MTYIFIEGYKKNRLKLCHCAGCCQKKTRHIGSTINRKLNDLCLLLPVSFILFFSADGVSCSSGLLYFLPLPPDCWYYRSLPAGVDYVVLGLEAMLGKHSPKWSTFPAWILPLSFSDISGEVKLEWKTHFSQQLFTVADIYRALSTIEKLSFIVFSLKLPSPLGFMFHVWTLFWIYLEISGTAFLWHRILKGRYICASINYTYVLGINVIIIVTWILHRHF